MRSKAFIWIFVGLVVILPILAFTGIKWYENKYSQLPVLGGETHQIGDFNMINAAGKHIQRSDWNNKIVVVDFFFTHCPTICPKMTTNLKKVQNAFAGEQDILINSFTVDPERDSVTRLAMYAKKFHVDQSNWNLLTGEKKEIYTLARKSFLVTATDGDGGIDDFIHTNQFILLDRHQRIRGFYSGVTDKEVNQLINDIKKLRR